MPADQTDINKMALPGGNTNAPASGTYGEGAALERLKQQLPAIQPQDTPPQPSPMPQPSPGAGISNTPSPGVPSAILAPTMRPDVSVNTPLAIPVDPMASAQSGRQRRLIVLDALAADPNVSDTTREWVALYRRQLVEDAPQ